MNNPQPKNQIFHIICHQQIQTDNQGQFLQQGYAANNNNNTNKNKQIENSKENKHLSTQQGHQQFPLNKQLAQLELCSENKQLYKYIKSLQDCVKEDSLKIESQYKRFRQIIYNVSVLCQLNTKRADIQAFMGQYRVVKLYKRQHQQQLIFPNENPSANNYQQQNQAKAIIKNKCHTTQKSGSNTSKPCSFKTLYECPIQKIKQNRQLQWNLHQKELIQKKNQKKIQLIKQTEKIKTQTDKELHKFMIRRKQKRDKQEKQLLNLHSENHLNQSSVKKQESFAQKVRTQPMRQNVKSRYLQKNQKNEKYAELRPELKSMSDLQIKTGSRYDKSESVEQKVDDCQDQQLQFVIPEFKE